MTEFVTIKPGTRADGSLHRVPMPRSYGLPHGTALPEAGWKVPLDEFVRRLIADKDAVLVTAPVSAATSASTSAPAAASTAASSSTSAPAASGTTSSSGSAA